MLQAPIVTVKDFCRVTAGYSTSVATSLIEWVPIVLGSDVWTEITLFDTVVWVTVTG